MKVRYGTFSQDEVHGSRVGVVDNLTGRQFITVDLKTAEQLVALINTRECRFDCRVKREADYLQGWVDRDRDCPITEAGKRCAKRYVAGAESGLTKGSKLVRSHDTLAPKE